MGEETAGLKLNESVNEYLFKNARDIILLVSAKDGRIVKANKAAVLEYGYSHNELINMEIFQLRESDNINLIKDQMLQALNRGTLFESMHKRKDGSSFPAEVSSVNISSDSNDKILMSIIRNITERKNAEHKFKTLYDGMKEGVAFQEVIFDEYNNPVDYRFIDVNKSLIRHLGLEREDIVGKTRSKVFSDEEKYLIEQYGEVALSRVPKRIESHSKLQQKYYDVRIYPQEKNVVAAIFTDITDIKLKEQELIERYEELSTLYEELMASEEELKDNYIQMEKLKEEAYKDNEAKSMFLANMSHEIRTPLSGLLGMINLLELTDMNDSQIEYCNIAKASGEHLLDIVNNILDISKIEAGKLELDEIPFSLKNEITRIVNTYVMEGIKKDIDVMYYYQPTIDEIFIGDSLRLNQVIINLMSNAVKYTEKGCIVLKVKLLESDSSNNVRLQFSIEDTGIGIDEESSEKLFKVFSQGDSSYTKKYGGTGLGLSICKELVSMMDGKIWYESEVGRGSKFYFTVVLKKFLKDESVHTSQQSTQTKETKDIDTTENNGLILVVEDNEINKKVICSFLDRKNYKYVCVSNGRYAVDECMRRDFKLILMDIQMPEINGFEAVKLIRKNEEILGKHTPIIAMTAYAMNGEREMCLENGMDDYISKPIDVERFYKLLSTYINDSAE